jgi:uncharacterized protein
MPIVKIVLTKKVNLEGHTLLEGFPGIGLIGTIAAGYAVEKLDMEMIGYIYSDAFPPMTTIHKGLPYYPARIYHDKKRPFCVLLAEFVVPSNVVHRLSGEILEFARENKVSRIVSLAGMSSQKAEGEKQVVYGIASSEEMAKFLKDHKIELVQEGVTTGVSGVLIAKCAVENFPAVSLLAESKYGYPDPRAAAKLLEVLDGLVGLKVDTKALLEEADMIEERMSKMLDQAKKVRTTYKKAEEEYPPIYR